MRQIVQWKPVRTFNYVQDTASAVFEPGLKDVMRLTYCSPRRRCIVRDSGVYDGIQICTLDRVTPADANCEWTDPDVPVYFSATICAEWKGAPQSFGSIELL